MKRFFVALAVSILYLVLGNLTAISGMHHLSNDFLNSPFVEILFAPYTFIGGMSEFAGWDWFSFVLEGLIFVVSIPFFYSFVIVASALRERLQKK